MSNRNQRRLIGVIFVAFVVVAVGVVIFVSQPQGPPMVLDPIPPSATPPENTTSFETIQVGSIFLNVTGNITGMLPHNGPITFHVNLIINVTNNGTEDVIDFHAIKTSLYYLDAGLFYTFGLRPDYNFTIPAGQTVTLSYQNNVTRLDTSLSTGSIYARILVSFNTNQECILTTPILEGIFAIE